MTKAQFARCFAYNMLPPYFITGYQRWLALMRDGLEPLWTPWYNWFYQLSTDIRFDLCHTCKDRHKLAREILGLPPLKHY